MAGLRDPLYTMIYIYLGVYAHWWFQVELNSLTLGAHVRGLW